MCARLNQVELLPSARFTCLAEEVRLLHHTKTFSFMIGLYSLIGKPPSDLLVHQSHLKKQNYELRGSQHPNSIHKGPYSKKETGSRTTGAIISRCSAHLLCGSRPFPDYPSFLQDFAQEAQVEKAQAAPVVALHPYLWRQ